MTRVAGSGDYKVYCNQLYTVIIRRPLTQESEMNAGFKHPTSATVSSHIATRSATVGETVLRSTVFFVVLVLATLIGRESWAVQAIDLPDFEGLVEDKGQAVVKVTVTATRETSSELNRLPNFNEDEMPEFFKKFFESLPDSCLLYTSPSPRDLSTSRMPSSA